MHWPDIGIGKHCEHFMLLKYTAALLFSSHKSINKIYRIGSHYDPAMGLLYRIELYRALEFIRLMYERRIELKEKWTGEFSRIGFHWQWWRFFQGIRTASPVHFRKIHWMIPYKFTKELTLFVRLIFSPASIYQYLPVSTRSRMHTTHFRLVVNDFCGSWLIIVFDSVCVVHCTRTKFNVRIQTDTWLDAFFMFIWTHLQFQINTTHTHQLHTSTAHINSSHMHVLKCRPKPTMKCTKKANNRNNRKKTINAPRKKHSQRRDE